MYISQSRLQKGCPPRPPPKLAFSVSKPLRCSVPPSGAAGSRTPKPAHGPGAQHELGDTALLHQFPPPRLLQQVSKALLQQICAGRRLPFLHLPGPKISQASVSKTSLCTETFSAAAMSCGRSTAAQARLGPASHSMRDQPTFFGKYPSSELGGDAGGYGEAFENHSAWTKEGNVRQESG